MAAKRSRVDWSKRPAPAHGSRERAAYERSAVYARRVKAAKRAAKTRTLREAERARREAARARKRAERKQRKDRIKQIKGKLEPKLAALVLRARDTADYRTDPSYWKDSRDAKESWSEVKEHFWDEAPDLMADVLEELADDWDTHDLGWNIEESGDTV